MPFSKKGRNSLFGANVLAIIVEVDVAALQARGKGPIWAVAAETRTTSTVPIRIERLGRPEVKNTILYGKQFDHVNRDIELRDIYNLEDPFHLRPEYAGAYRHRLNANLAMLDRLNRRSGGPLGEDGAHPLTGLLLADHLIVDLSRPFAAASFLEIEQSLLEGGARTPPAAGAGSTTRDGYAVHAIDNAGREPRINDGVDVATKPADTPPRTWRRQRTDHSQH